MLLFCGTCQNTSHAPANFPADRVHLRGNFGGDRRPGSITIRRSKPAAIKRPQHAALDPFGGVECDQLHRRRPHASIRSARALQHVEKRNMSKSGPPAFPTDDARFEDGRGRGWIRLKGNKRGEGPSSSSSFIYACPPRLGWGPRRSIDRSNVWVMGEPTGQRAQGVFEGRRPFGYRAPTHTHTPRATEAGLLQLLTASRRG